MKTPTFSFIIPHKNTPDLLQKCLDSIPHRKDVEIIVVDDNSDPTKVDFEHFPGLNDACVKVIFDKDGGGCSHATNIALNNATGKWIVRGDADDFFEPDIVKAMDEYADSNYDIIFLRQVLLIFSTILLQNAVTPTITSWMRQSRLGISPIYFAIPALGQNSIKEHLLKRTIFAFMK